MRLSDPCNDTFHAQASEGHRPLSVIRLIVLHTAENDNARSVAQFFTRTNDGSAHLVVGQTACYRCLRNDEIPVAAAGANLEGFHIEQAAFARWTTAEWEAHDRTLRRGAYKAAVHAHKFNIAPRFLGANDLIGGARSGVTTHVAVNAWQRAIGAPGDHSHTDPGAGWPRLLWMHHFHRYYNQLGGS